MTVYSPGKLKDNPSILAATVLAGIPHEHSPQGYDIKPEVSESDIALVKVQLAALARTYSWCLSTLARHSPYTQ